jgi:hypothetical protein
LFTLPEFEQELGQLEKLLGQMRTIRAEPPED